MSNLSKTVIFKSRTQRYLGYVRCAESLYLGGCKYNALITLTLYKWYDLI